MTGALTKTDLPRLSQRGKVRDIYDLGDALLLVTTDRISAFDLVLPDGIPEKGVVLNELSRFWFEKTAHIVPNHLLAMGSDKAKGGRRLADVPPEVARRSMLVKKAQPILVECVARGYLAGSAWAEYRRGGTIGGLPAPAGMKESQRLAQPLFTPTTKAAVGHDEAISAEHMGSLVGGKLTRELERLTLAVYSYAHELALKRGIIIADTKLEFGMVADTITLVDEALTPDSSRFWEVSSYAVGRSQDSLDKQIVRDWLTASGWNREPPAPRLPAHIIEQTSARYKEAYKRLTGQALPAA